LAMCTQFIMGINFANADSSGFGNIAYPYASKSTDGVWHIDFPDNKWVPFSIPVEEGLSVNFVSSACQGSLMSIYGMQDGGGYMPLNDEDHMYPGKGYWAKFTSYCKLDFSGTDYSTEERVLQPNTLYFVGADALSLTLDQIMGDCDNLDLKKVDANGNYISVTDNRMWVGNGYWLKNLSSNSCTLAKNGSFYTQYIREDGTTAPYYANCDQATDCVDSSNVCHNSGARPFANKRYVCKENKWYKCQYLNETGREVFDYVCVGDSNGTTWEDKGSSYVKKENLYSGGCGDGYDNDADGMTDGADSDCGGSMKPDLKAVNFVFNDNRNKDISSNSEFEMSFGILNQGQSNPEKNPVIRVFNPTSNSLLAYHEDNKEYFSPGKIYNWSIALDVTSGQLVYGNNIIQIFLDYTKVIDESNESNNDVVYTVNVPITPPLSACTDSDGGKKYYTKGTVLIYEGKPTDPIGFYDYCQSTGSNTNILIEQYCENGVGKTVQYNCPNGCGNGACKDYNPVVGDLISADSTPIVYYIGGNTERYVIPEYTADQGVYTQATKDSWGVKPEDVKIVSQSTLESYAIRGNVLIRPGTKLLRGVGDSQLYAVGPKGVLHEISNLQAEKLYAYQWENTWLVQVPDVFLVNYTIGNELVDSYPDGTLITYLSDTSNKVYLVYGGKKYLITGSGMVANGFTNKIQAAHAPDSIVYPTGDLVINTKYACLTDLAQLSTCNFDDDITKPDFEVIDAGIKYEINQNVFWVKYRNNNNSLIDGEVAFKVTILETGNSYEAKAGAGVNEFTFAPQSGIPGNLFNVYSSINLKVDIDSDNKFDESNENNNSLTKKVTFVDQYDQGLAKRLAGRLLLAVEDKGRVYYDHPGDLKKYEVTFGNLMQIFQDLAMGITYVNLNKIPINSNSVSDKMDSDGDGFNDKQEAENGYDPFGPERLGPYNYQLSNRLQGKMLLVVDKGGQIWYVDQAGKRWQVTWENAMNLFMNLSLGITNDDLDRIEDGN